MEDTSSATEQYRGSLSRRLFILFLAASLTPLFIVGFLEYFNAKTALSKSYERQLSAVNLLIAREIENYYNNILKNLLAHADSAASLISKIGKHEKNNGNQSFIDSERYKAIVKDEALSFSNMLHSYDYQQILLTNEKGDIIYSQGHFDFLGTHVRSSSIQNTPLALAITDARRLDVWQSTASAFDYSAWHGVHEKNNQEMDTPEEKINLIHFLVIPVHDQHRNVIGTMAIGAPVYFEKQKIVAQSQALGRHVSSYIVDKYQKTQFVLGTPMESGTKKHIEIDHTVVRKWLNGHLDHPTGATFYEYENGELMLGVAQPLKISHMPMLLVTEVPKHEALAALINFRDYLLSLLIAIIIAVFIASFWMVVHITHPLKIMTRWANSVANGKYIEARPMPLQDEIGKLSKSFSIMTQRLRQVSEENEARAWLQKGLIELNNLLRSESQMDKLSQQVINWLCQYLGVNSGELWFYQSDGNVDGKRKPLAKSGTLEKVDEVSHGPRRICRLPLIFRGEAVGQLVLKPYCPFTPLQQTFLTLIMEPLAVGLYNLQLYQHLDRASRYKSEFLATISHELRTPLHSILTLSQILEENNSHNLTTEQQQSAGTIHRVGNELLHLINDILDLSKVEVGQLSVSITSVELPGLLRTLETQFNTLAANKKLVFSIHNEAKQKMIRTDRHRLAQILKNLLGNALKFTERGFVKLIVKEQKGMMNFSVMDTGIGIAKDQQIIIFNAFKQVDSSNNRQYSGTGLGLFITNQLAALLRGKIIVESELSKGSCFTLSLPLTSTASTPTDKTCTTEHNVSTETDPTYFVSSTEIQYPERYALKGINILIVEKNMRCAFHLSRVLEPLGMQVKIASSVSLLETKLAADYCDLILVGEESVPILDKVASSYHKKWPATIMLRRQACPDLLPSVKIQETVQVPCQPEVLLDTMLLYLSQRPRST